MALFRSLTKKNPSLEVNGSFAFDRRWAALSWVVSSYRGSPRKALGDYYGMQTHNLRGLCDFVPGEHYGFSPSFYSFFLFSKYFFFSFPKNGVEKPCASTSMVHNHVFEKCSDRFLSNASNRMPVFETAFSVRKYSSTKFGGGINSNLEKIINAKIIEIENKYDDLQQKLLNPDISPDSLSKINKEVNSLEKVIFEIKNFRHKEKEVQELIEMVDEEKDEEIIEMAKNELVTENNNLEEIRRNILLLLLPRDSDDQKNCILEVRAGTGGEEASLFAMEIFKMYEKYAQLNKWKFEIVEMNSSDLKGIKEGIASISGDGVYEKLKYESGVHRVQRVPITERGGRIHTSAASVAVLPEADEFEFELKNEELRIDCYRSGGSGGQSVNTTSSAVRVTHLPTGTMVAIQDERSQHQNKAKALKILRARLYDMEKTRRTNAVSEMRHEQIGSGDRSERIRTYNFPQGRVTDHRVGITMHNLEMLLQGEGLDEIVEALDAFRELKAIEALTKSV